MNISIKETCPSCGFSIYSKQHRHRAAACSQKKLQMSQQGLLKSEKEPHKPLKNMPDLARSTGMPSKWHGE
jgi:hypothetical protein